MKEIKVSVIGLDTSHSIEFVRLMQSPAEPEDRKVAGLRTIACLRFGTPFQSEQGLDERQRQLEQWGVRVTQDFDQAVAGADALAVCINDPAYHLEYFTRCAALGKPIFLDKPMADTLAHGQAIYDLARRTGARVFSASSLRFVPELLAACAELPQPVYASTFGPLGIAPAGSSIVWYGVHSFEMLQRAVGRGARSVSVEPVEGGIVAVVRYGDGRRGVVDLAEGAYVYGGCLRDRQRAVPFVADVGNAYLSELRQVAAFFAGAEPPLGLEDTLEVMALLDAAERSLHTGRAEPVGALP